MNVLNWFSKENRLKRKEERKKKLAALLGEDVPKLKLGLALGGGGTKGYAHIGAIKAFKEMGIEFDYVAGTSVGSIFAASYCNDVSIERMEEIALKLRTKDITTSRIPLVPSKTEKLEKMIEQILGNIDITELKKPLTIVAVNMVTGTEVHLTQGSLVKAIAGSCAVPGIFNPVAFEDMLLLDGGLQNTIPSDVVRDMGADVVIAVDLNSARGYGTDSTKYLEIIKVTIRILMKSNAVKGYVSADLVITPDLKRFNQTKIEGAQDMVEEGYRATMEVMPKIMSLINRNRADPTQVQAAKKIKEYNEKTKVDPKTIKILDAIENDDFGDF